MLERSAAVLAVMKTLKYLMQNFHIFTLHEKVFSSFIPSSMKCLQSQQLSRQIYVAK